MKWAFSLIVLVALVLVSGCANQFTCPAEDSLSYDESTKTYWNGMDCMPGSADILCGSLKDYPKWVNENCGLENKYEIRPVW